MFSLFQNLASLAFESQQVIFLRTMKMAAGGPGAEAEARLMVAEKLAAAEDATMALMSGKAVDHVVASYRRRVRANSRRLMKG
ncbi:hypothetical protein LB518_06860 [Mesorhizobium sp. BR1-1-16]|uniref:hypothetical protein n=1 Tax=Mesorhizobium sp. BR1-1-16 TaxID=2876653 RepID=UPI001CC99607|nr:hypothetical protein [Mesorhizobium sp. BR1-1-16]MBZ9936006.1 hypothetical protein [Mesorhizobium sp. BR1-1-16]